MSRRAFLRMTAAAAAAPLFGIAQRREPTDGVTLDSAARAYHVAPGGNIQTALEAAASDSRNKTIYVHAGTYRPAVHGQALIWFNRRHDGITLEGQGEVILTAANPAVADSKSPSFPAVVNHVVYFGDGISTSTVMRGFRITGANNYTTGTGQSSPIEADEVPKTPFFYLDGGGIKIYARSYPTIERVEVVGNRTGTCGAGVSVEHLGNPLDAAVFRDCIFRDNRTQITGAAFDLLHGSRATLENCLFTGNVANLGVDFIGLMSGGEYHPENGSGAMTVFERSRASVTRCTFTGNWAGVDDNAADSSYVNCIFWNNTLKGGISKGPRYEIDITNGGGVKGSFIHGQTNDLRGTIDKKANRFDPPDPRFDAQFAPQAPEYAGVGYRPAGASRGHIAG